MILRRVLLALAVGFLLFIAFAAMDDVGGGYEPHHTSANGD